MPGPNSIPNGDTTVMRGHANEKFVCLSHGGRGPVEIDGPTCNRVHKDSEGRQVEPKVLPLRWYLGERNRLRTGKTK